jgi:hypothetical protein
MGAREQMDYLAMMGTWRKGKKFWAFNFEGGKRLLV